MNTHALQALLWNILQPLHRQGIHTLDMAPWHEEIRVTRGPTLLSVALQLVAPEKDMRAALKQAPAIEAHVASALGLPPGQRLPVRVVASGAYFIVEVPRLDPWRPSYGEIARQATEAVLLGLDTYSQPVAVDLTAEMPGMLVVGRSGSGKSNAMRLIAAQRLARGDELWLIDLKGGADWADFRHLAGGRWATTEDEGERLLGRLTETIKARNAGRAPKEPRLLLIVDEVANFDAQQQQSLARLVKEGRSALLRTIVGNQRCGKEMDRMIRANLTWRLVGLVADATESHLAAGSGAGADALQGCGDMLFVEDGRAARRLQVARADPIDLVSLLGTVNTPALPPTPATALAQIPRTIVDLCRVFEHEAERVGKGYEIPHPWVLARANEYAIRTGRAAPFDLIREWSRRRAGKALSKARMDDVRSWSLRIANVFRVVPGVPG
jgi:hypothetical protein